MMWGRYAPSLWMNSFLKAPSLDLLHGQKNGSYNKQFFSGSSSKARTVFWLRTNIFLKTHFWGTDDQRI